MYCSHCGSVCEDDSKFCRCCGNALIPETTPEQAEAAQKVEELKREAGKRHLWFRRAMPYVLVVVLVVIAIGIFLFVRSSADAAPVGAMEDANADVSSSASENLLRVQPSDNDVFRPGINQKELDEKIEAFMSLVDAGEYEQAYQAIKEITEAFDNIQKFDNETAICLTKTHLYMWSLMSAVGSTVSYYEDLKDINKTLDRLEEKAHQDLLTRDTEKATLRKVEDYEIVNSDGNILEDFSIYTFWSEGVGSYPYLKFVATTAKEFSRCQLYLDEEPKRLIPHPGIEILRKEEAISEISGKRNRTEQHCLLDTPNGKKTLTLQLFDEESRLSGEVTIKLNITNNSALDNHKKVNISTLQDKSIGKIVEYIGEEPSYRSDTYLHYLSDGGNELVAYGNKLCGITLLEIEGQNYCYDKFYIGMTRAECETLLEHCAYSEEFDGYVRTSFSEDGKPIWLYNFTYDENDRVAKITCFLGYGPKREVQLNELPYVKYGLPKLRAEIYEIQKEHHLLSDTEASVSTETVQQQKSGAAGYCANDFLGLSVDEMVKILGAGYKLADWRMGGTGAIMQYDGLPFSMLASVDVPMGENPVGHEIISDVFIYDDGMIFDDFKRPLTLDEFEAHFSFTKLSYDFEGRTVNAQGEMDGKIVTCRWSAENFERDAGGDYLMGVSSKEMDQIVRTYFEQSQDLTPHSAMLSQKSSGLVKTYFYE